MFNFIGTDTNTELMIVYSLVGLIIVLIIIVLLIDHFGKKKEKDRLDSKRVIKNLKKIQKEQIDYAIDNCYNDVDIEDTIKIDPNQIIEAEKKVESDNSDLQIQTSLNLNIDDIISDANEDLFEIDGQQTLDLGIEEEMEKTQAQIDVEEITSALERAIKEEERIDPYQQFEDEQEENAIISYDELEKNFDRLYDENEKRQYMNDDNLPININELYQKNEEYHSNKVKLEDMNTIEVKDDINRFEFNNKDDNTNGFKNSPFISPVFGIQKEANKSVPVESKDIDEELAKTTEFLNTLKELQKNLDN